MGKDKLNECFKELVIETQQSTDNSLILNQS